MSRILLLKICNFEDSSKSCLIELRTSSIRTIDLLAYSSVFKDVFMGFKGFFLSMLTFWANLGGTRGFQVPRTCFKIPVTFIFPQGTVVFQFPHTGMGWALITRGLTWFFCFLNFPMPLTFLRFSAIPLRVHSCDFAFPEGMQAFSVVSGTIFLFHHVMVPFVKSLLESGRRWRFFAFPRRT